jgi:hypothetical protein
MAWLRIRLTERRSSESATTNGPITAESAGFAVDAEGRSGYSTPHREMLHNAKFRGCQRCQDGKVRRRRRAPSRASTA